MNGPTNLNDDRLPVGIAPGGYSLEAPGIVGTVRELSPAESATRSDGGLHEDDLINAMTNADVVPVKLFEMQVQTDGGPAAATSRASGATAVTATQEPAIVLRVPELQSSVDYVVLHSDEAGVSRWIFPEDRSPGDNAITSGNREVVFHLPRASAPMPPTTEESTSRGPISKLGRRMFRVLAWATDGIVGQEAKAVARLWEGSRRPYGFLAAPFSDTASPLSWKELGSGLALLLLHGTFSTSQAAFSELPDHVWQRLTQMYHGRIFSFNHPSLHQSPEENAQTFIEMLPPNATLEVDLLTHSRGGLLGRELTERFANLQTDGKKLRVRKAIFVASPNLGTLLADGSHGVQLLDRYTHLFAELPDTAFTLSIEGLFMVAKLLAHGALAGLPGLECMYPPGNYLQRFTKTPRCETQYYTIAAAYQPSAPGVIARFGGRVAGKLHNDMFGEDNDGVVPTRGSYESAAGANNFPIAQQHRLIFNKADGVHHCNYFGKAKAVDQIVNWLIE